MTINGTRELVAIRFGNLLWSKALMSEMFEADIASATRKSTGAKFSISLSSPEYSKWQCRYENPQNEVNVVFRTKWICEIRQVKRNDRLIAQPILTGAILFTGELRPRLIESLGTRANKVIVDLLINDCYELMIRFLKGRTNLNRGEVEPHIYEAEASGYGLLPGRSFETEVGPEWVARSKAKLII